MSHGVEGYQTVVTVGMAAPALSGVHLGSLWTVLMHETPIHVLDFFLQSCCQFPNECCCKVSKFPISEFSTWNGLLCAQVAFYSDVLQS